LLNGTARHTSRVSSPHPRCLSDRLAGRLGATHRLAAEHARGHARIAGLQPRAPAAQRPVRRLLFSTKGREHLYAGRTGITARTRRAGGKPGTSFRTRFDQHTRAGSSPASAPFAMRLARAQATERDIVVPPAGWWKVRDEHVAFNRLFTEKKSWITDELQDARRRPRQRSPGDPLACRRGLRCMHAEDAPQRLLALVAEDRRRALRAGRFSNCYRAVEITLRLPAQDR